jgi:curved DNA-binding protein CbpA
MTLTDYYKILDLPANSSIDEIKKAYRKKARIYHPDINPSPDAKDIFISITEAYEFLIVNHDKINSDEQEYSQAMEDWRKYRQDRSRKRATAYAQAPYGTFKNTRFYKTTRIFDGTTIIFSFIISIIVLVFSVIGYTYRLRHPIDEMEKPSLFSFIMLLSLGMVFFVFSFIFLKAFLFSSKKQSKKR